MGFPKALVKALVLILPAVLWGTKGQESAHALFMMQSQSIEEALSRYEEFSGQHGHDFDLLQRMGQIFFAQGIQSEDPDDFVMTLFGAGLSGSTGSLEILERGLYSGDPQLQMIALHFIAKTDDDRVTDLLSRAMTSPFLSTRMEAAYYMSQKKHPHAVGQIEGLMVRLPPFFRPFFPSLFALIGTSDATASLRRLLDDLDPQVRIESILNIAKLGRDDLLPVLRKRLTQHFGPELEACVFAMGALKDSQSIPKLKRLALSPMDNVKIAAILTLYELGERSFVEELEKMALKKNLFAIAALSHIPSSGDTLAELIFSDNLQVRINAGVSLAHLRDPRCLDAVKEILVRDSRDIAFCPFPSPGRTIGIWKAVPSAELRSKDTTCDLSLSLSMREQLLIELAHLDQEKFVELVRSLFQSRQLDLIPTAIALLENLRTPEAIGLLKEGSEKMTSPLIRDYCHLSLYRLKEEGPYEEAVKLWVMRQKDADLIRLRPILPWKVRLESDFVLTAEETSRLLIDSFVAIASSRNIDFLLRAIRQGNPHNRYALFGLLMRATE